MKKRRQAPSVLGVTAPRARPTPAGAVWLATLVSLPAGLAIVLIEAILRWVF